MTELTQQSAKNIQNLSTRLLIQRSEDEPTKHQAGIWVELSKAIIVLLRGDSEVIVKVSSDITSKRRATGGKKANHPYMHDTIGSESKIRNRRDLEIRDYFAQILKCIDTADDIAVFGSEPARTLLEKKIREVKKNIIPHQSTNYRTTRRFAKTVRNLFKRDINSNVPRSQFH